MSFEIYLKIKYQFDPILWLFDINFLNRRDKYYGKKWMNYHKTKNRLPLNWKNLQVKKIQQNEINKKKDWNCLNNILFRFSFPQLALDMMCCFTFYYLLYTRKFNFKICNEVIGVMVMGNEMIRDRGVDSNFVYVLLKIRT